MSTKRVIIVGGGFAGLSAAYTLMKRGITPLLLEAQDHVGERGSGERAAMSLGSKASEPWRWRMAEASRFHA